MTSQPDRDALATMRSYASNLTERQLRRILIERKSFEDWAVQVYEQALSKKRVQKRLQTDGQRRRQSNAKRDSLGRYVA